MCINADAHRRAYGSPYSHPDERKIHLSPRSTSHTPSSTPHYHQPPTSTNPPSTPPQSSSTAERRDTPATSAAKVPLTRRKWLESSIPGLIFGGGGEEERREGASDGKEHAISSDDHERQSSMRSQPAVPSSRCKLSPYIEKHGKARVQGYLCFNCLLLRLLALLFTARVPAMVNFSSGAPRHSPHKRQPSSSPKRPVRDPNSPSEQQSSMMKAVQKVVLGEEGDSGENPANHGNRNHKWFEGGGDLAESALKAVRAGNVIATNERSYPSPADNRKKQVSKAKEPVSNVIFFPILVQYKLPVQRHSCWHEICHFPIPLYYTEHWGKSKEAYAGCVRGWAETGSTSERKRKGTIFITEMQCMKS